MDKKTVHHGSRKPFSLEYMSLLSVLQNNSEMNIIQDNPDVFRNIKYTEKWNDWMFKLMPGCVITEYLHLYKYYLTALHQYKVEAFCPCFHPYTFRTYMQQEKGAFDCMHWKSFKFKYTHASHHIDCVCSFVRKTMEEVKKVRFNEKVDVLIMYVWQFAYKQSRISELKQQMIDKCHFKRRIDNMDGMISAILQKDHREKILKRFLE